MSSDLSSVLQQLKIESLAKLCGYNAEFIAKSFNEEQLTALNNALRDYLWQAELLPTKMRDLNQGYLPLEVLGLAPHIQINLANDGIQTVAAFIQRDTTDRITAQWSVCACLAVRIRIFCLLTLSPEQIEELRQSSTTLTSPFEDNIFSEPHEFVDKLTPQRAMGIEALNLSYKVYESLHEDGIETIGYLSTLSDKYLLKIPGIGFKALIEIREKLSACLNNDVQPELNQSLASLLQKSVPIKPTHQEGDQESDSLQTQAFTKPLELQYGTDIKVLGLQGANFFLRRAGIDSVETLATMSDYDLLKVPGINTAILAQIRRSLEAYVTNYPLIDVLNLSPWVYNCLKRAGIDTVADLATMDNQDLLAIQNLGVKMLAEIHERLTTYLENHPLPTPREYSKVFLSEPKQPQPQIVSSPESSNIPKIELLGLSIRAYNCLKRAGINTIEHLATMSEDELLIIRNLGPNSLAEIQEKLSTYLINNSLSLGPLPPEIPMSEPEQFQPHTPTLAEPSDFQKIEVLGLSTDKSPPSSELSTTVEFWLSRLTPRELQVINLRYGFENSETLTLEQVGQQLSVTRERIRQIEAKALRKLKKHLREYKTRPLNTFITHLFEKVGGVINETQLIAELNVESEVQGINLIRIARLVFDLHNDVTWLKQTQAWVISNELLVAADEVINIQARIFELVEQNFVPSPLDDLLNLFKQSEYYQSRVIALSDEFILACIRSHSALVEDEYGRIGLEKWTRKRLDDLILALRKIGRPTHYTVIAEETNALLPPDQQATPHNIHAQMQRLPDIFVRVGHGIYGLKEWGLSDDGNLANACYRVLREVGQPLHIDLITKEVLKIWQTNANSVYAAIGNDVRFILFGEGIFSLNEWERSRLLESEPALPFCPLPLPDLPGQTDTLLESILIAQEYLRQNLKVSDFLTYMLKWVGSELSLSSWLKQSILNAYYLVGLIPYTFHFEGDDPVMRSTLPSLELPELRRYCLQKFTERLIAMPEFWWIVRHYQPGTISDFAEHFVEVHPLEFDDVANRLKILAGLGAIQRLPYGRYQLTSFGAYLASEWAKQPDFSDLEAEAGMEAEAEEDFSILDLGLW